MGTSVITVPMWLWACAWLRYHRTTGRVLLLALGVAPFLLYGIWLLFPGK
jgi:hypothetical protein